MAETPVSDFFVRAALKNTLDQSVIVDPQKRACLSVIMNATVRNVVRRQLTRCAQPYFVEHPPEIIEPANLVIRAPQILHFHITNVKTPFRGSMTFWLKSPRRQADTDSPPRRHA